MLAKIDETNVWVESQFVKKAQSGQVRTRKSDSRGVSTTQQSLVARSILTVNANLINAVASIELQELSAI